MVDKKECTGSFTLQNDGKLTCKGHQHDPMQPIECEIKKNARNRPNYRRKSNYFN